MAGSLGSGTRMSGAESDDGKRKDVPAISVFRRRLSESTYRNDARIAGNVGNKINERRCIEGGW
jgi:CO/xanthine dehydrogenase FAD-binding subunit